MLRFRPTIPLFVLLLSGCGTVGVLKERDLAVQEVQASYFRGRTPVQEFERNKEEEHLSFYAMYSHFDDYWFPGLNQKEVDEFIVRKKMPYERRVADTIPIVVDDGSGKRRVPSDASVSKAIDEYLTAYNQMVRDHFRKDGTTPDVIGKSGAEH